MSPTAITAAVVQTGGAPFELTNVELAGVQPDEVRVRITASGICHTDLLIRDGSFPTPMPVVLGHEGAGVVEEVGAAVTRVAVGDRVACSYASCGGCAGCATGRPYYCAEFFERNFLATRADGTTALSHEGRPVHSHFFGQSSFATGAIVPERSVVTIADDVPFEIVAPFGCGVQTGAGGVIDVAAPAAGLVAGGLRRRRRRAVGGDGGGHLRLRADHRGRRAPRTAGAGAGARRHPRDRRQRRRTGGGDSRADRRRRRGQPGDQRRARRAAPGGRRAGVRRDLRARRRPAIGHRGAARRQRGAGARTLRAGHRRGPQRAARSSSPNSSSSGAPAACRSSGWCAPTTSIRSTRPRMTLWPATWSSRCCG